MPRGLPRGFLLITGITTSATTNKAQMSTAVSIPVKIVTSLGFQK